MKWSDVLIARAIVTVAALILAFTASPVRAAHSDVDFEYHDSMIEVEFGSEGRIFEADFRDGLGAGDTLPHETDDPGYFSHAPIGAGDGISANVLGPLLFHDGAGFMPTAATITLDNGLSTLDVDGSTAAGMSLLIGEADVDGDVHAHLNYLINPGAPVGAYGVLLSLSTDASGIADSESFYIVFNRGLDDEEAFEERVEAFAELLDTGGPGGAGVPEPASASMLMLGLSIVTGRRRRRVANLADFDS